MASCTNRFGFRKIRHKHEADAFEHMNRMKNEQPDQYFDTYFCYVCFNYHVGHRKQPRQYDEVLVGKLIGALKQVINRQPN